MPEAEPKPPYKGAKHMLPEMILEDRENLVQRIREMYDELPAKPVL